MNKEYIIKELITIIQEITNTTINNNSINYDTIKLKELGVDSLMLFKFILKTEERFRIKIEDIDLDIINFIKLSDVLNLLNKYENKLCTTRIN